MDQKLVSLIVPVYRHPDLVQIAVESALAQTWKHLEILLVDDGSPDGCGAVCDDFATKDARIQVFHTENRGVSAARNIGLKHATGDYITFLDSDDRLEPDHVESLVSLMEETGADLASVTMLFYRADGTYASAERSDRIREFSPVEAVISMHREGSFNGYLMNKMFRRERLCGIFFQENIAIHEDMLFLWDVIPVCRKIVLRAKPTYHYLYHTESAMNRGFSPRYETAVTASEQMLAKMKELAPEALPLARKTLLFAVLSVANRRAEAGVLDRDAYKKLRALLKRHHDPAAFRCVAGTENRISYRLLRISRVLFLLWKKCLPVLRRFQ